MLKSNQIASFMPTRGSCTLDVSEKEIRNIVDDEMPNAAHDVKMRVQSIIKDIQDSFGYSYRKKLFYSARGSS